jgi:hypothetical protein
MTVEFTIPGRRKLPGQAEGKPPSRASRPPRIACLLALAHRFDELVQSGAVRDYAELARLGHVTRARVTQIMNLLNLAPDIQESILWLSPRSGRRITEREMRTIAGGVARRLSNQLRSSLHPSPCSGAGALHAEFHQDARHCAGDRPRLAQLVCAIAGRCDRSQPR